MGAFLLMVWEGKFCQALNGALKDQIEMPDGFLLYMLRKWFWVEGCLKV